VRPTVAVAAGDRAAALGSEGLRTCKSESQVVEGQNYPATVATTESCTINLGPAPESLQDLTGVPPSADGPRKEGARGKWASGTQDEQGGPALTRAVELEGYRVRRAAPPAHSRGKAVADGKAGPESRCPSRKCVVHATGDLEHRCPTPPAIQGSRSRRQAIQPEASPSKEQSCPLSTQNDAKETGCGLESGT